MSMFNTYSSIEEAYEFLNPDLQKKTVHTTKDPLCELYNIKSTDPDLASFTTQYQQRGQPSNSIDTSGLFNKVNYQHQNQNGRECQDHNKLVDFHERPSREHYMHQPPSHVQVEQPRIQPPHFAKPPNTYKIHQEDELEKQYNFQPSLRNEDICSGGPSHTEVRIENINKNENINNVNVPQSQSIYEFDEDTILKMLSKKYMNEHLTTQEIVHNAKTPPEVNYIDLILYICSGVILIFILEQFVKLGTYF